MTTSIDFKKVSDVLLSNWKIIGSATAGAVVATAGVVVAVRRLRKPRTRLPITSSASTIQLRRPGSAAEECWLPDEIWLLIFRHLGHEDIWRCGLVCKTWYTATRNEDIWRQRCLHGSNLPMQGHGNVACVSHTLKGRMYRFLSRQRSLISREPYVIGQAVFEFGSTAAVLYLMRKTLSGITNKRKLAITFVAGALAALYHSTSSALPMVLPHYRPAYKLRAIIPGAVAVAAAVAFGFDVKAGQATSSPWLDVMLIAAAQSSYAETVLQYGRTEKVVNWIAADMKRWVPTVGAAVGAVGLWWFGKATVPLKVVMVAVEWCCAISYTVAWAPKNYLDATASAEGFSRTMLHHIPVHALCRYIVVGNASSLTLVPYLGAYAMLSMCHTSQEFATAFTSAFWLSLLAHPSWAFTPIVVSMYCMRELSSLITTPLSQWSLSCKQRTKCDKFEHSMFTDAVRFWAGMRLAWAHFGASFTGRQQAGKTLAFQYAVKHFKTREDHAAGMRHPCIRRSMYRMPVSIAAPAVYTGVQFRRECLLVPQTDLFVFIDANVTLMDSRSGLVLSFVKDAGYLVDETMVTCLMVDTMPLVIIARYSQQRAVTEVTVMDMGSGQVTGQFTLPFAAVSMMSFSSYVVVLIRTHKHGEVQTSGVVYKMTATSMRTEVVFKDREKFVACAQAYPGRGILLVSQHGRKKGVNPRNRLHCVEFVTKETRDHVTATEGYEFPLPPGFPENDTILYDLWETSVDYCDTPLVACSVSLCLYSTPTCVTAYAAEGVVVWKMPVWRMAQPSPENPLMQLSENVFSIYATDGLLHVHLVETGEWLCTLPVFEGVGITLHAMGVCLVTYPLNPGRRQRALGWVEFVRLQAM